MTKDYDMLPGATLSPALQQDALRSFVHRYTGEHVPAWSQKEAPNGSFYAPQYVNDKEWLEKTMFPVEIKRGETQLASGQDVHCQSNTPSFPWGQWLDVPFKKGMSLPSEAPALNV